MHWTKGETDEGVKYHVLVINHDVEINIEQQKNGEWVTGFLWMAIADHNLHPFKHLSSAKRWAVKQSVKYLLRQCYCPECNEQLRVIHGGKNAARLWCENCGDPVLEMYDYTHKQNLDAMLCMAWIERIK